MNYFGRQPRFENQPVIEQKPFENPAVRSVFAKWCKISDSIRLRVVTRDEWDKRGTKSVLEKESDGRQALFIPKDLQLWEMIGIIEAVDSDTFAANPERRTEAKEKLLELAKTFQNAGTYIAQRLDGMHEGRHIAEALASEFYEYGQSLAEGKRAKKTPSIEQIASQNLSPSDTEMVDRFLAGDNLYESRRKRVEQAIIKDPSKRDELYEAERQKALAQFFRVAKKAFGPQIKSANWIFRKNVTELKPWQNDTPIHSAFLAKIEQSIAQEIETPKRELEGSIFRRGMELLQKNMPFDKLPYSVRESYLHWQNGETTLRQALQIDAMRADLEAFRKTGDLEKIGQKEREIADKIQGAVSRFPYQLNANNPAEMVINQCINCVGASTLGGALMKEAGLNYLVGCVFKHSILFLVTSNGKLEWRDMLNNAFNENLTDETIVGTRQDGLPLTVADIVAFSYNPKPQGLMFDIKSLHYQKQISQVGKGGHRGVVVFGPEYGQKIQILNNMGATFLNLGRDREAIEAYQQAVATYPQYAHLHNKLGDAFASLGQREKAMKSYRRAIAIDSQYAHPHNGLANIFASLGQREKAMESYRRAIAIDSQYAHPHNGLANVFRSFGQREKAIEEYQIFIDLADKEQDYSEIKQAEQIIKYGLF